MIAALYKYGVNPCTMCTGEPERDSDMGEDGKRGPGPDQDQRTKTLTGAAMKLVGVVVLVFAVYYAAELASYAFFATFGSR